MSESRIKIYEQLEETVAELEMANKRMHEESKLDKARIRR